jgi:hypothetical protein
MPTPRKRAPGGGRKPKGEFAGKKAAFTTRITADTRAELERGADKKGASLSQHIEFLLKTAMHRPTAEQLRHQALGRAVESLAANIERKTGENWRHDPFTAQALLHAIDALLVRFAPVVSNSPTDSPTVPKLVEDAAVKMPDELAAGWRTPAGLGHISALAMIAEIEDVASARQHDEWAISRGILDVLNVPNDHVQLLARELAAKGGKS